MRNYRVGFIFHRCFLQKEIELESGIKIIPLLPTGFAGMIHDVRRLLEAAKFQFLRRDMDNALKNFSNSGQTVMVQFTNVEAQDSILAIESKIHEAENIIGGVSVLSKNPAVPLCGFATQDQDSVVKFFIPNDTILKHATNIPGVMDALPEIVGRAQSNAKFSLLVRLFRASLREIDIDNQLLFLLILFEEASDNEKGNSFAERLRNFSESTGFIGDLSAIAKECNIDLPPDRDVIDLLVKLRNSAAHNGKIDEESLRQFKAEWVIPILEEKENLHTLIVRSVQYMFCCMVGHSRDEKAIKITGPVEIKFD